MVDDIIKRIQKLEEMLSYQEQTVDALNDVIIEQQFQLDGLENQLHHLQTLLTAKHTIAGEDEDPPPPHY